MKSNLPEVTDQVIKEELEAVDRLIEDLVEPLADVGNPEKLIGKPYDLWTLQDKQMLGKIYGTGNNTPLANLIFRREYSKLKELEKEVA
jgi:hypothetical protein